VAGALYLPSRGSLSIQWVQLAVQSVAALSTACAVVVALYIGLSGQRATRKHETDMANLVAARLAGTLATAADSVRLFRARLWFRDLTINRNDEGAVRSEQTSIFDAARRQVQVDIFDIEISTLAALIPLPNHCAHRIAAACGNLRELRREISAEADQWPALGVEQREQLLQRWGASFGSAAELLIVAQRECEQAASIGAPHPTGLELHGEE
jgi:hypothetical protein